MTGRCPWAAAGSLRGSAVRGSAVRGSAVRGSAVRGSAVRGSALRALRAATVPAVAALLIAGCGSVAAGKPPSVPAAAPLPQLATAVTAAAGASWAIVVMGGASAQENDFWELFSRPAGTPKWRLATPVGVADNGGIVAAVTGLNSLVTGFRPSQDLLFSPLASTADGGASWSTGTLADPGLADVPDALAAGQGGQLIALGQGGGAQLGSRLGTAWTKLASVQSLASTPAGRACGLTGLTAAAFGGPGGPLLAGRCGHPGIAGIFALRSRTWTPAGPAIPAPLARGDVEVLRMGTTGPRTQVLLESGAGATASLLAAWSTDGGARWRLSAPLRPGSATVRSASFGPGGAVGLVLGDGLGEALAGPGASWRALPGLPRWTATLAVGPAGHLDALTAHGSSFADWRLAGGAASWSLAQTLRVEIPYGSSS